MNDNAKHTASNEACLRFLSIVCRKMAVFQILKNRIFATFPPISPFMSTRPSPRSFSPSGGHTPQQTFPLVFSLITPT